MSKTTDKLGKPITLTNKIDAEVQPSKKLLKQWENLDRVAHKLFKSTYDKLSDRQKADVHTQNRKDREAARKAQEARDSATEVRLNHEDRMQESAVA